MKTADVILGGKTYTVSQLTVGDFEVISEVIANGGTNSKTNSTILAIALAHADPPLEGDVRDIPTDIDELATAVQAILNLAGIKRADPQLATAPVA